MSNYTFLPDTSVVYNRRILSLIQDGTLENYNPVEHGMVTKTEIPTIILSRVMLSEVENQANQTKAQESVGLEVLHSLYELEKKQKIAIRIVGERPKLDQIRLNPGGELDALIRNDAFMSKSILITADEVQSSIALVEGIDVLFTMNLPENDEELITPIQDYFDEHTMSVHLRGHCFPMAKRGKPGNWKLEKIADTEMHPQIVANIANQIIREAKNDERSFIEKNEAGVSVVQLRSFRIVICRPPFSNTYEVTAVKPLVHLTLDDYNLSPKVFQRLEVAEGILVAGSPGAGKSTFISALSEFYLEKNKLVKTLESVRDLNVPHEVSQYAPLDGSLEKTADILLLIRPDFTIFDEVRTESDFKIFADMRLAGVGLVGVVHASQAIDAAQRFIRRVELGVIPSVIDTIIFIDEGQVGDILYLEMTVKKPTGFADRDLSRPVIEVRNFLSNDLMYEIYAFGSDVIVAPIGKAKSRSRSRKSDDFAKPSYERQKPSFGGVSDLESIPVKVFKKNKGYNFSVDPKFGGMYMKFFANDKEIFSGSLSKSGNISIKKQSPVYRKVQKILQNSGYIEARVE